MKISQLPDLELAALLVAVFSVLPLADQAGLGAIFISAATNAAQEVRARGAGRHADCDLFCDVDVINASQLQQLVNFAEQCAEELERIGFLGAAAVLLAAARGCRHLRIRPDRAASANELRNLH